MFYKHVAFPGQTLPHLGGLEKGKNKLVVAKQFKNKKYLLWIVLLAYKRNRVSSRPLFTCS
jgi:hypothetical protein